MQYSTYYTEHSFVLITYPFSTIQSTTMRCTKHILILMQETYYPARRIFC